MRQNSLLLAVISAVLFFSASANAETPAVKAKVVFTDSTAAPLTATKRVAITNVMVSFQASVGGEKTNTSGLFAAKTDSSSALQMPSMDAALMGQITDAIYEQLKEDLKDGGYEVVPESVILANATYQKMIQMSGIPNFSKFSNLHGDIMLVGATGLHPYLPYIAETGKFSTPAKTLIEGWSKSTQGGPTVTSTYGTYELPGLEVALAKELNAHVFKANYVVTLGSTNAAVDRFSSSYHNTYSGTAFAQVGLLAGQSRLAFRTPLASTKGETASRGYTANFGNKAAPAKDGDVVLTLEESLAGGTDFFELQKPQIKSGGLLSGLMSGFGNGADKQFTFIVSISDPEAYKTEVISMVKLAQRDMLSLAKP
ncbi:MAG: hypothetical protein K2P84_07635 [Undibacterium sp.]|nr:hypothetical protein [Undibacterium sp.]